ncbi:MAG TPA: glycoside hydrolase family 28 protein [Phycisphaerae bacterium]|nr:glycoside hydrolase family 28 protein [Phycisphaerae bacterium]
MLRKLPLLVPLLLAAAASAADIPAPLDFPGPKLMPAGKDFPITDYGAVGDGKTLNTDAIQKAIDAAAPSAGTVVIPKGTFVSGAIFIKKPVNLRIDKDGILKGSTAVKDYPVIDSRFEGIERPVMAALVNVIGVSGITVSGQGTIDGSGDVWLANFPRVMRGARAGGRGAATGAAPASRPTPPATVFTGPRTVLTPTPNNPPMQRLPGATLMKPRLFNFTSCDNVAIKDLHLQNQAIWCLHILYSTDVLVDNLQIHEPLHRIPSSDGIDIDSSKRVRVDHTTIEANDDCISIKSGKDEDGRRVNRPSEDILIVNTHLAYGQGGVAMGSEVSGGIHHVEVRDCTCDDDNWAPVRLKTQPTRGGTVDDIVYRNYKIANVRQAFEFTLAWNMRINNPGAQNPTTMKDIYLINVSGTARRAGEFEGLPDKPITDVHFIDCHITADAPLRLNNTERVDTSGLTVKNASGETLAPVTGPVQRPPGPTLPR